MAKEIDKIIQSKTAPKSNNVLWDDGENLKINRNGKWESTGTSVPQEKIDSIDFGYYTYASGNIVANWGPFTIKEGETIKVDTNTWVTPTHVKFYKNSTGYIEEGDIWPLEDRDGALGILDIIRIKLQGTILEIYNKGEGGTVTIQFLCYEKQHINSDKFSMSSAFLEGIRLREDISISINKRFENVNLDSCIGKYVVLDWGPDYRSGFCVQVERLENGPRFTLLQFPSVIYVTYTIDNDRTITDVQVEEKTISLV